jgi:long-chain acyl-CoA synthetase
MAAGCVTVPTYTTNMERDHQHILDDSGARAVIVSTQKLAKTCFPPPSAPRPASTRSS